MLTFLLIHSFHAMHAYIHSRICDWSIEREFSRIPVFFIGNPVSLRYPCSTCSPVIFRTIRTLNHGLCHSTWCIAFMRCMHKRIHGSKVKVVNAEFRGFGFFFFEILYYCGIHGLPAVLLFQQDYHSSWYMCDVRGHHGNIPLSRSLVFHSFRNALFPPPSPEIGDQSWNCTFPRESKYSSVTV